MAAPAEKQAPEAAPWLSVVGLGEEGLAGLPPLGRALIERAGVLVGGRRHLAMIPEDGRERLTWPTPLKDLIPQIVERKGQGVCVLATGDPLSYGVATTLLRHIPAVEMTILPAASAFSLACARLGWALPEVETLTLHGRPLALLQPFIQPGARLLLLSENGGTPAQVAALLRARGYGPSRLVALEHMGGEAESREEGTAADWPEKRRTADLNTLAVECRAEPGAPLLPRTPGLPDEAFRHDGKMTKREVRAVTLAALGPGPGQLLWDVGAGSGSVAIEWLRAAPRTAAFAIEREAERRAMMADNAAALGTPQLKVVPGEAPFALQGLEAPDAIFIGGGLTTDGLVAACWEALKPGGRLVANAVTLEGERALLDWQDRLGGNLTRLAISRAEPVGPFQGWRPLMPVTQWALAKA